MDVHSTINFPRGTRPEDYMEGPTMRRLCICTFECPLCHQDHESHIYITIRAENLDDYHAELQDLRSDWQHLKPAFKETAMMLHQNSGDLAKLMKQAVRAGSTITEREPVIELTSESAYTCDDCSRKFDSIDKLDKHAAICA